jgi:hypothetical protein
MRNQRLLETGIYSNRPVDGVSTAVIRWHHERPSVIVALNGEIAAIVSRLSVTRGRLRSLAATGSLVLRADSRHAGIPSLSAPGRTYRGYYPWQVKSFVTEEAFEEWLTRDPKDIYYVETLDIQEHILRKFDKLRPDVLGLGIKPADSTEMLPNAVMNRGLQ